MKASISLFLPPLLQALWGVKWGKRWKIHPLGSVPLSLPQMDPGLLICFPGLNDQTWLEKLACLVSASCLEKCSTAHMGCLRFGRDALPSLLVLLVVETDLRHIDGKVVLLLLPPQWYSVWLMLQKPDFQCFIFLMIFFFSFHLPLLSNKTVSRRTN